MRHRPLYAALLIGLMLLAPISLRGDIILLKNGNEIQARIISRGKSVLLVEVPYGTMTIPLSRIEEIRTEDESKFLRDSGQRLLRINDLKAGLQFLRRAAEGNPDSKACKDALLEGLLAAATRMQESHRLGQLGRYLEEAEQLDPKNARLKALRESSDRLLLAKKVLEEQADEAQLTDDFPTAYRCYLQLLEGFPEERETWRKKFAKFALMMGHVEYEENLFEAARTYYHQALEHEPDLIAAMKLPLAFAEIQTAIPLLEEGAYGAARERLQKTHDLIPDDPAVAYYLALSYEGEGKLNEAAHLYERLSGVDGESINGAKHLARLRELAEAQLGWGADTLLAGAQSQKIPAGKTSTYNTRHFTIHHQNAERARTVGQHLEHHLARLKKKWFSAGSYPVLKQRIQVHLYGDAEAFQAAVPAPSWSGGLTMLEQRMGIITRQSLHFNTQDPQFLAATLPHELSHAVLPHRLGAGVHSPKWLDEGLASNEEPEFKQIYFQRLVREAAADDTLFSLNSLFSHASYPEESRVPLFYAQSNSVVRYLLSRLGTRAGFALLKALAIGPLEQALLENTSYSSLLVLERSWLRWVKKQQPR
ncbi:MAG: peptidase MA family metallohydrolase [Planctomycetota bacterium]